MRGARSAAFEDAYELAPLLGEDDNASTQSSEVDAPLGSDDDHVEPPGFDLISLFALFSETWLWRWAVLTTGSISMVIAIGLMIDCLIHISRPGPWVYYNLFPGALASAFLLLRCIEVSWIRLQQQLEIGGGGERTAMTGVFYWSGISVFSLVSAGAWYLAGKMDLVVVHVLGLLIAFPCVLERYVDVENKYMLRVGKPSQKDPPSLKEHSWRQSIWTISGYSLGLVQILHITVMFLFFIGGMDAWASDFAERGLPYKVEFDDGATRIIHVLCLEAEASEKPMIWFEAGQNHGTWWTSSLQSDLLRTHNRSSCSYDNPGYGRSDPASVYFTNSSSYWPNLLKQLGKEDEPFIGVGWGSGTQDVISHALQTPSKVKGLVIMDTYPTAVEWMDNARRNHWDEPQTMAERQKILQAQIRHERWRLMFGISWFCANLYTYYNYDYEMGVKYTENMQHSFRKLLIQEFHDKAGSFTYYSLIKKRAQPMPASMPKPNLPASIPVFGIVHNNTRPSDLASNAFRREQQELMVASIAGGRDKIEGMAWCSADNCTDPLPLYSHDWLASIIMGFGI